MSFLTKHLEEANESYFEHGAFALKFASLMLCGGLAAVVHGIFPFLFEKTGSRYALKVMALLEECNRVNEERKKRHGVS